MLNKIIGKIKIMGSFELKINMIRKCGGRSLIFGMP